MSNKINYILTGVVHPQSYKKWITPAIKKEDKDYNDETNVYQMINNGVAVISIKCQINRNMIKHSNADIHKRYHQLTTI